MTLEAGIERVVGAAVSILVTDTLTVVEFPSESLNTTDSVAFEEYDLEYEYGPVPLLVQPDGAFKSSEAVTVATTEPAVGAEVEYPTADIVGPLASLVMETDAAPDWLFDASLRVIEKFFTPSAPEVSRLIVTFPPAQTTEPVLEPLTQTVAQTSPFTSTATELAEVEVAYPAVTVGLLGGVTSGVASVVNAVEDTVVCALFSVSFATKYAT